MNNQLPKNNIPQNDSEKTENVFQSVKKSRISNRASWTILGAAVLAVGGAVWYYSDLNQKQTTKDYYQELADKCGFDSCCARSVETMRSNGYKQIPADGCPKGLEKNQFKCANSYSWCEPKKEVVFYSQEECEQKTSKSCDFQTCDFIPLGKTFEETCGKDFKKGWIPKNPVLDQTPSKKQKIIGKIIFSDIEGGCWNFQGDNGEYFLVGSDNKSEEIKKIPNILSKKVEIQGKIEKDIVSYCPVGDGLFKLESYKIIEDSKLDSYKGCGTDSDCKLIYDSCDCEAVNIKNTRSYLPSSRYVCFVNNCATYNTTAVCENNQCIKKNN